MNRPKFYTVKEFAALVGVRPQTVYQWIYKGHITSELVGPPVNRWRARRIPASELNRILETDTAITI